MDLFGGSGTCLIACEQLGRKCYMMERDPKWVAEIIARWEGLTKREAVLI
jgi:site-specific DNA-methyltransferase (adenine-specific)